MPKQKALFSNGFEFTANLFKTGHIVAISCGLLAGLCIGYYLPLISFWMHDLGFSGNEIGVNTSSVAVLVFGAYMPKWLARLGGARALFVSILGTMLVLAMMPFFSELTLIYGMRFLFGFAFGFFWIASETWINSNADAKNRGVYISLYATLYGLGICLGPQFLKLIGTTGKTPFFFGLILFLPALLAIRLIRKKIPAFKVSPKPSQKKSLFWQLPLAFLGVFLSGVFEVSISNLFNIFAMYKGVGDQEMLSLLSVFALGNFLCQFPIGWLADRFSLHKVIVMNCMVAFTCLILVSLFFNEGLLLYVLMFFLGGSIIAFYTLSLILLGHHFSVEDMTRANMFFIVCFTIGGLIGPFIAGHLVDFYPNTYFYFMAILALGYACLVLTPKMRRVISE